MNHCSEVPCVRLPGLGPSFLLSQPLSSSQPLTPRWVVNSFCWISSLPVSTPVIASSSPGCHYQPGLALWASPPLSTQAGLSTHEPLSSSQSHFTPPNPFLSILFVHFLNSTLPYSSQFASFIFIPLATFLFFNTTMLRFTPKGKCLFPYWANLLKGWHFSTFKRLILSSTVSLSSISCGYEVQSIFFSLIDWKGAGGWKGKEHLNLGSALLDDLCHPQ